MRLRKLDPIAHPVEALLALVLIAGWVAVGFALGVGWAGVIGVIVGGAGVVTRRLRSGNS